MHPLPRTLVTAPLAALALSGLAGTVPAPAGAAPAGHITLLRAATYRDTADEGLGSVLVRALVRYRDPIPAARTGKWFAVTETTLVGPGGRIVARSAEPVPRLFAGQNVEHRVVIDAAQASRLAGDEQDLTRIRVNVHAYVTKSRMASNDVTAHPGRPVLEMRESSATDVTPTAVFPAGPQAFAEAGGLARVIVTTNWDDPSIHYVDMFAFRPIESHPPGRELAFFPAATPVVGPDRVATFTGTIGAPESPFAERHGSGDVWLRIPAWDAGGWLAAGRKVQAQWTSPPGKWYSAGGTLFWTTGGTSSAVLAPVPQ